MATLSDIQEEQAKIKGELQRMETDESITEEGDGDLRDTLVARWQELDAKSKPLIARMEVIRGITHAADDPANLERPDGQGDDDMSGRSGGSDGGGRYLGGRGPDLMTGRFRNPYDNSEAVRNKLVARTELRGRAFDGIEM